MLSHTKCFQGSIGQVSWYGRDGIEELDFLDYMRSAVCERLYDQEHQTELENDLNALAITGMASETLREVLAATTTPLDWEVGEALAECLLQDDYGVTWPWNADRDKRTPKASLPGADLIGFIGDDEITFLLGEVKTSSDTNSPPGVMYGRSGMMHQLDTLARKLAIHRSLINYLHARCKNTEHWPLFERAMRRYLESGGKAVFLVGILLRDIESNELDLRNRGESLGTDVEAPTAVELNAWYLPSPINDWVDIIEGGAS